MQKDKTFFQLKQPAGETISLEDAVILMQVALEEVDAEKNRIDINALQEWVMLAESGNSDNMLTYEGYSELLSILKEKAEEFYESYTYPKKYKDEFYLLKDDWYRFYDAFLDFGGLKERIKKKQINVVAGKENLSGETIGENYVLTDDGEVLFCRSSQLKSCNFTSVIAYIREKSENSQKEILVVKETEKKPFTLDNVWVMETQDNELHFFYKGYEITAFLSDKIKSDEVIRETVSDISLAEGCVTKVLPKTERVGGRLLRMNDSEIELEGKGIYTLAEEIKVYRLYEELREAGTDDLRIGYDFADFVLEDGKVCAALIMRKENMETIRIAIKNEGFASFYHEKVILKADCDMKLIFGPYEERKQQLIRQGEEIIIEQGSEYLSGARVELLPEISSGKMQICSLNRNQGVPSYRGRFEIVQEDEGLVLINEVLLEEYLYSVVPSEMPASYPHEALKAQAVCARTYAYKYLNNPGLANLGAHVDDSVNYQVYNNIAENYNSTKAVKETMGELLFFEGEPVDTYYYSTSCGFGADAGVWQEENKEAMPYLTARHISEGENEPVAGDMMTEEVVREYLLAVNEEDYESKEAWYRWEYNAEEVLAEDFCGRLQARQSIVPDKILTQKDNSFESLPIESFEEIYDIIVTKRRNGGVIDELMIYTDSGNYKVISEYNVRFVLNAGGTIIRQDGTKAPCGQLLPSAYFVIDTRKNDKSVTGYHISGGGYGHGVGMSQNAAKEMAGQGKMYGDILQFFYQNCELKKMY